MLCEDDDSACIYECRVGSKSGPAIFLISKDKGKLLWQMGGRFYVYVGVIDGIKVKGMRYCILKNPWPHSWSRVIQNGHVGFCSTAHSLPPDWGVWCRHYSNLRCWTDIHQISVTWSNQIIRPNILRLVVPIEHLSNILLKGVVDWLWSATFRASVWRVDRARMVV